MSDASLVVMEKRGRTLLQQTSHAPGEPSDWSPECGASADAPDGVSSWLVRGLGFEMLARTDVF